MPDQAKNSANPRDNHGEAEEQAAAESALAADAGRPELKDATFDEWEQLAENQGLLTPDNSLPAPHLPSRPAD